MPDDHHPLIWSLTAVASVLAIVFTRHAMSAITDRNPIVLAALACCIPLMACLNAASASEHRSRAVTREFQREHPCPSTGRTSGVPAIEKIMSCPSPVAVPMQSRTCNGRLFPALGRRMHGSGGLGLASRPETDRKFAHESANPIVKHPPE